MCTIHESKKKNLFYSSLRLKNHFFLSLTPCLCLSPKSLSSHSLSKITFSLCLSFSPKSPINKLSSSRPSRPKAPNHSPSLFSHRHALSLSSLTPLLTGFDCEIELTGFDCFVVVLRWVFVVVLWWISWLCSDGFL